MKQKSFKRIIVFGVLLAFVALCAVGFVVYKSCDGDDGDDDTGKRPATTETDPTKIGYYFLPDNFVLSISADNESFNYVKFDGGYYMDSARNGGLISKKYLAKTGDGYAFYQASFVGDELVWGEAQTLTAEEGAKRAFTMLSSILKRPDDGDGQSSSVSVQGTPYQCVRIHQSATGGSVTYFVLKDYDFWIKNENTFSSGKTIIAQPTLLNLNLSAVPDFVSLPA